MRVKITAGANVYLIAGESQAQSDGNDQGRLLNEINLNRALNAIGTTPVTLDLSIRNDDAYILRSVDLWAAAVEVTADGGQKWSGKITAYDNDADGVLRAVATERAAPELEIQFPDEVARLVTVDENFHTSAVNVTLPLVIGGTVAAPHLIKGILIDKTAGIYLLCVGEIHQVVKVYRGTEELSTGFTAYAGTAGQASYPGFAYVAIDEAQRLNDDGSYVEISAEIVGLKLGASTIEECRNGARFLRYLLTTAAAGANGWGLGIAEADIDTTSFTTAISRLDTAGLKLDGVFYFRQVAQSWIDQICQAIRGGYSIGDDGKRRVFVNASASSTKAYTASNMRVLRDGKGAFTGRVYNKGALDYGYNPITGQFMQSAQYENATSIAAIGEQEFYGQSYLIKDAATAQAILEYNCKKSLIGAEKVLFETIELAENARVGDIITITHPEKGLTGDWQITSLEIGDYLHTIEAEKFDASIFAVGTPGTAIDWTKDPPIIPTINPGAASGLTLSSEVRPSPDGTNIIVLKGNFTPPAGKYLAASIEWGEGALPILSWNSLGMVQGNGFEIAPVKPAQAYAVRVRMTTSTGHSDYVTATITTEGDEVPPGAPSIGVTSYLKTVKIAISLASVPSDMAGFAIYRHTSNNSAAASQIGSITSKDGRATYTDEAPAYGATYYYWVKSFDTWGNLSSFSSAGSVFISNVVTSDLADQILSESRLFAQGVVDAAALSNAALKQAGGAVAAWSAKGCTTASIAEAGGVVDTTGNGNNGQAFGGVAVVNSEMGRAFAFDGINDYIGMGFPFSGATACTLAANVKIDSAVTSLKMVVSLGLPYVGLTTLGRVHFSFLVGGVQQNLYSPVDSVPIGKAFHVIATHDGTTAKIYIDGVEVASGALGAFSTVAAGIFIGNHSSGSYYLAGLATNIRIFSRALSATEAKCLNMFPDDAVFARITADFIGTYELVSRHFASDSVVARMIAAQAVTMEKLLVGAPGAALNDDPGFMDASAWETMDGFESHTGWALAAVADGKVGVGVMRGNGSASPYANNFIQKRYIPIDLSKTYRLHCLARKRDAATDGSIYLSVREYNNAKAVLSTNAGHYLISNIAPGTTWTEYNATIGPKGQFQFPAGTAFARIGGMIDYGTNAGAGYELQDFRLEECTPSTLIQNGAILGQHLTVEEAVITVGAQIAKLAVGNAHISDLHGGKIIAGSLAITGLESSAQTTISTAYTNAGTALTNAATAQTTANNAASAASAAASSAATANTKAGNLATNGLGVKVNYATFAGANNGELYLHGFDASTGAAADVDGWVMWNGAKVTVTKGVIDPNAICPYNIPLYAVQRSGTKYIVWFDATSMAWKYAAASATVVVGTWTWAISTDIVLLTFISPSSEGALVGMQVFVPPKTGRDIQDALDAAILSWAVANNLTYIDGAKIFTDSIYAHSINAAALKAPAGAVAAWSAKGSTAATIALTGGVKDVSGNGRHGQAVGGVSIVDSDLGPAFNVAGWKYLALPGAGLTSVNRTFACWFRKTVDEVRYVQIMAQNAAYNGGGGAGIVGFWTSSDGKIQLNSGNGSTVAAINSSLIPAHNVWYMIVGVIEGGSSMKIYINGVLNTSVALAINPVTDQRNIYINGYSNPSFDIAHPRVYNRALTAAEVKTLYMIGTDAESGTITADRVVTGQIKSLNYSTTAGSMIDLDAGDVKMGGSSAPRFSFTNSTNTGVFAGFTFNATDLTAGSGDTAIGLSTDSAKKLIWAGHATPASAPFQVARNGSGRIGVHTFDVLNGLGTDSTTDANNLNRMWIGYSLGGSSSNIPRLYASGTLNGYSTCSITIGPEATSFSDSLAPVRTTLASTSHYGFSTNGRIYSGGGYYPISDERCKSEITDVSVLGNLRQIRVKKYHLDDQKIAKIKHEKELLENLKTNNAVAAKTALPAEPDIENYNPCKAIGVMAQDFNKAFGIGNNNEETYNLTDAIGVALRAIQELAEIVDDLKAENAELRAALKLPAKQKKQAIAELTAEEIERAADAHVKAAYENIMQELKR